MIGRAGAQTSSGYPDFAVGLSNITALNGSVSITLSGMTTCSVQITALGNSANTFQVQASPDGGTTWYGVSVVNPQTWVLTLYSASINATGVYMATGLAGMSHVRVICNAYTSGTATVTLRAVVAQPSLQPVIDTLVGADGAVHRISGDNTGAVNIAQIIDGNIVTLGNTGDGKVADATGTVNAHLRQIAASSGPVTPGTAATNSTLGGLQYNSTPPTLTTGQQAALQGDAAGNLFVDVAKVGGSSVSLGSTTSANSVPVVIASDQGASPIGKAISTGGATPYTFNNLSSTVQTINASAASTLYSLDVYNASGAVCFVEFFDVATSGGVMLGTTVPKWSVPIAQGAAARSVAIPICGIAFSSGIQAASVTAYGGSTGSANGVVINASFH